MPKTANSNETKPKRRIRPASTSEARENQLISMAMDLAEEKILNGTASSQLITHFLKLGSTKERLEKEIMERQKELITAKTEAIKAAEHDSELYQKAVEAMQKYSGNSGE